MGRPAHARMTTAAWLHRLIEKSAWDLEVSGKTIFHFGDAISVGLNKNPIQSWEADGWARGLKMGLVRLEGYFFRVGSGKRSPGSFFIRNENDLYVGLRRESVTQAATYVQLITEYGYPRSRSRFETRWMDVAVYGEDGHAWIYAENKASQKTLEKLCAKLTSDYQSTLPPVDPQAGVIPDALMKAHHIWKNRPHYFWAVCPTYRQCYSVGYGRAGFRLEEVADVPSALEWVAGGIGYAPNSSSRCPG